MPSNGPSQNARNEQAKLLGTFLNNTGVACVVTGLIGPAAGVSYGATLPVGWSQWAIVALAWLLNGTALHVLGRRALRRIV